MELIAVGPQPATLHNFGRPAVLSSSRLSLLADQARRRGLADRLTSIRRRAKKHHEEARRLAETLSRDDVDFLRDIGEL